MQNKEKKTVDILIFSLLGVSILAICFSAYQIFILKIENDKQFFSYLLLLSIFSSLLFLILFNLYNYKLKIKIVYLFIFLSFTLSSFEIYLNFLNKNILKKKLGSKNINFDSRTPFEVFNDLKKKGFNVVFTAVPNHFISSDGITYKNKNIYPIGSIPGSYTFFYNLEGFYPIIKSDKYGFNNPNEIYEKKIDIILVGGSHGEGYSVRKNNTISGQLRNLNYNVMNLSRAHNGALLKLASIQEYAYHFKPKIVLWLYYEYDLRYLLSELNSAILSNYLIKKDFQQNLKNRQNEINETYKYYLKNEYNYFETNTFYEMLINFLRFPNMRKLLNIKKPVYRENLTNNKPIEFEKILNKANNIVSSWGGKLYFVSLPDYKRFSENYKPDSQDFVVETVKKLQIPFIDMYEYFKENNNDHLSIFPHKIDYDYLNHYNGKGYSLVTKAIYDKIKNN